MLFDSNGTESCGCNKPGQVQADRWTVCDAESLRPCVAHVTPTTTIRRRMRMLAYSCVERMALACLWQRVPHLPHLGHVQREGRLFCAVQGLDACAVFSSRVARVHLPQHGAAQRNWKFLDSMWCMSLALSLNALNGFANTVVYALLTNYVQRLEDRSPNLFSLNTVQDHRHSFRVAFGEQSVDEPVRTSWTPSTSDFNSCEDFQEEVLCCFEAT